MGDEPYHTGYTVPEDDEKTSGPATAKGEPIGVSGIVDLTVNTAKGIGKGMAAMARGDTEGAKKAHDDTAAENREISKRAARNYRK